MLANHYDNWIIEKRFLFSLQNPWLCLVDDH